MRLLTINPWTMLAFPFCFSTSQTPRSAGWEQIPTCVYCLIRLTFEGTLLIAKKVTGMGLGNTSVFSIRNCLWISAFWNIFPLYHSCSSFHPPFFLCKFFTGNISYKYSFSVRPLIILSPFHSPGTEFWLKLSWRQKKTEKATIDLKWTLWVPPSCSHCPPGTTGGPAKSEC